MLPLSAAPRPSLTARAHAHGHAHAHARAHTARQIFTGRREEPEHHNKDGHSDGGERLPGQAVCLTQG